MSDPVRDASKEATAGEKCSKRVMGTFRSHLCEKPAKVVEGKMIEEIRKELG